MRTDHKNSIKSQCPQTEKHDGYSSQLTFTRWKCILTFGNNMKHSIGLTFELVIIKGSYKSYRINTEKVLLYRKYALVFMGGRKLW